jgi:hypothetical protein
MMGGRALETSDVAQLHAICSASLYLMTLDLYVFNASRHVEHLELCNLERSSQILGFEGRFKIGHYATLT